MDTLPPLGRGLLEVLGPTLAAYEPLLLRRESEIKSTRRTAHQYGATDPRRQALDVYYPDATTSAAQPHFPTAKAKPVLLFLYGGGFIEGERRKADYARGDLVFANIGHYFAARHGLTVVIPDYRLALVHTGARFPSGGEDVALVVDWIARSLTKEDGYGAIDLFILGNSAGGVHAATWALHPAFAESVSRVTSSESKERDDESGGRPAVWLKALLLLGVPAHFNGESNEILRGYFGAGADDIAKNAPLGLLKAATQRIGETSSSSSGVGPLLPGVKVAALLSELDPEYVYQSIEEFVQAWPDPGAVETYILEGHNHISPQVSLGTGIEREEAWGIQVADICRSAASS